MHYLIKYNCGHVKQQCKCIGPKTVTILPDDCPSCTERKKEHNRRVENVLKER